MQSAALSLLVLGTLAMLGGAAVLWRRGTARRQAMLMLVLAAVMAANVAIWVWPDAGGHVPLDAPLR